jgi:predicted NBD/HSP70 family sugar kinase
MEDVIVSLGNLTIKILKRSMLLIKSGSDIEMDSAKISNSNIRRHYNFYRVLRSIWLEDGISRKELGQKLNLDKATMSTIVSLLISLDIVEEITLKIKEVKPGRRPIGLGIRKGFGYIVGFEYHVSGLKAVIKDLNFNTIKKFNFPQRIKIDQIKSSFFSAYCEVKTYLKDEPIIGIGVAIPGVVDHDKGVITHSWELGVVDEFYDFQSEVFDLLDIPGFIDNDANCCAWGVISENRTDNCSNFLYTLFSYEPTHGQYRDDDILSLGLGIVIDGKPYFGPDYTSGEFQTMIKRKDSGNVRINQFAMTREEQDNYEYDGAIQLTVYKNLADHLALLVNFFNFNQVYIGGDTPSLVPDIEGILLEAISQNRPHGDNRSCSILIDKEKDSITASGAAGMFLEQIFTVPEMDHDRGALTWRKVFNNIDLSDI